MKKLLLLTLLIMSPLMGQENISTLETNKNVKTTIKSIFSINYSMGASQTLEFDREYVQFQIGTTAEYIVGQKWHWYVGFGGIYLQEFKGYLTTGLGVTLWDNRNTEGIGWMIDWNIMTLGVALTDDIYRIGLASTSNFRARYMIKNKFGIQIGFDLKVLGLFDDVSDVLNSSFSVDIYYGASFGLAFGS